MQKKVLFFLTVLGSLFFGFSAQAQDGEQVAKDNIAFDAERVEMTKTPQRPEVVPGAYVFYLNEKVVPNFLSIYGEKEFRERGQKAKLYKEFQKENKERVLRLAEKLLDISPRQITDVFVGGLSGFVVEDMKEEQAKRLRDRVAEMDEFESMGPDFYLYASASAPVAPSPKESAALLGGQSVSWGTNFTGYKKYTGIYWAWIVDTGIDLDHPDLNVKKYFARSFVPGKSSANDDNGHGTHVAGIVAAKDNNFGTRGVAAGAGVVPIKVLNSKGKGKWSWILKGFNYACGNAWRHDVINLSLGGAAPSWWVFWKDDRKKLESAIKNAGKYGIYVTIAAGNSNKHAKNYTPARANGKNVYTISAMDWYRRLAGFSNYGNGPVDYAAPGVAILSTYKNGGYVYLNGTSMAAPHVAGILLINKGKINTRGRVIQDKDSNKDYIAVK